MDDVVVGAPSGDLKWNRHLQAVNAPTLMPPLPFFAPGCASPPEKQAGLVPFANYFGAAVLASLKNTTILNITAGDSVLLDAAPSVQFGGLRVLPGARLVLKDSTSASAATMTLIHSLCCSADMPVVEM